MTKIYDNSDMPKSLKTLDANELLTLYENLIRKQTRRQKTFKDVKLLGDVYSEVFKRVFEYNN